MTERTSTRHGQAGDLPKIRFRLRELLKPGETALADILFYSGTDEEFQPLPDSDDRILVQATFWRAFGFSGEEGWAELHVDNGVGDEEGAEVQQWEVTSMEGCLLRPCVAVDPIASGADGTITINGVSFEAKNVTEGDVEPTDKLNAYYLPYPEADRGWKLLTGAGGEDDGAIVRVISPTPNETTCLWAGKLATANPEATGYCTDQFANGEDIWLLVLDSDGGSTDAEKDDLVAGELYLGHKIGAIGEPAKRIYAIRNTSAGGRLVRFQLTDDLVYGVDATEPNAQIMIWDTGTSAYIALPETPDITVFDYTKRFFEGRDAVTPYGSRGWAQKMPDRDAYEVVWMEPIAPWARYVYDLIGNEGTLTVGYGGVEPADPLDVADPDTFFAFKDDGPQIGFRDPVNNRYITVMAKTRAGFVGFEAMEELTPAVDSINAEPILFWGTQQDILEPPAIVTVANQDLFKYCENAAKGISVLDNFSGFYIPVVIDQRALLLTARAAGDFAADDTTLTVDNVALLTPFPFGGVPPALSVVKNYYDLAGSDNDKLLLLFDQADGEYIAFRPGGKTARRYKGVLNANCSTDDATTIGVSVVALDGSGPIVGPVTLQNHLHKSGKAGDFILIDEDRSGEGVEYILSDVRHYKVEPITDQRYSTDDHEFQFKRTPITAMWEADEDTAWSIYHSAVDELLVTAVSLEVDTLVYSRATAWLLEPLTGPANVDIVEFENFLYIEDVAVESGVLKQTYRNGLALGIGSATTETIFTPTLQRVVEKVEDIGTALVQTYVDVYVWRVDEGFTEGISIIGPCDTE